MVLSVLEKRGDSEPLAWVPFFFGVYLTLQKSFTKRIWRWRTFHHGSSVRNSLHLVSYICGCDDMLWALAKVVLIDTCFVNYTFVLKCFSKQVLNMLDLIFCKHTNIIHVCSKNMLGWQYLLHDVELSGKKILTFAGVVTDCFSCHGSRPVEYSSRGNLVWNIIYWTVSNTGKFLHCSRRPYFCKWISLLCCRLVD